MVLSSPQCHRAYLRARQELLVGILKKQNEDGLIDMSEALITIRAKGVWFEQKQEEATALLDTWRRRSEIRERSTLTARQLDQPKDLNEVVGLLCLFRQLLFFLKDYSMNLRRPPWIDQAEWVKMQPIKLSNVEAMRIIRALCRLQLFANICGHPTSNVYYPPVPGDPRTWNPSFYEAFFNGAGPYTEGERLFLGTMPPWEHEEIECVWLHLKRRYLCMKNVDHPCSPPSDTSPSLDSTPESEVSTGRFLDKVDEIKLSTDYRVSTGAVGPDCLYRLMHAVPLRHRQIVPMDCDTDELVSWESGVCREKSVPRIYPADQHDIPEFRQLWSRLPPVEQPNLGWRDLCLYSHRPDASLSDVIHYSPNKETDWSWGYAIWDAQRLESWAVPSLTHHMNPSLRLLSAPFYSYYRET